MAGAPVAKETPQQDAAKRAWLLLGPASVVLAVLALAPALAVVGFSFLDWTERSGPSFGGFSNFYRVVADKWFWNSTRVTLAFVVAATIIELLLGVAVAAALEVLPAAKKVLRAAFAVPIMLSPAVVGIVWRLALDESTGSFTLLLNQLLGTQLRPLSSPAGALLSLVVIDVWQWTPFVVLLISLSLDLHKQRFGEAVCADGLTPVVAGRSIWLPLLMPAIGVALVLRTIDCLRVFEIAQVTTSGGPGAATEALSLYTYRLLLKFGDFGRAATAALVMLLVASGVFLVASKMFLREWARGGRWSR